MSTPMTDKKKISHTIEVLTEVASRYQFYSEDGMRSDLVLAAAKNLDDLVTLLQKPHDAGGKEKKPLTPGSVMCAEWLHSLIRQRKTNFREPNWSDWYSEMDKIMRIDKRTCEQLHELIDWSQQDSFWMNNILSPSKLRKQLDRLELQMAKDFHWQKGKLQRTVKSGPSVKEIYLKGLEDGIGAEPTDGGS